MPRKRHLEEAASPLAAAVPEPAAAPRMHDRGKFEHGTPREPDAPERRRVDVLDHISAQMRPPFDVFKFNARFEWARKPSTYQHEFTRFYFTAGTGQNGACALLDIFASHSPAVEKEIEQKRACIEAENVRRAQQHLPPIGYLPVMRGATIPFEAFEAVKAGAALDLLVRIDRSTVLT